MHVVTMAAGNVTNDTRVKRQALSLARGGLRTTVLSRQAGTSAQVRPLGDAMLLRVPVPTAVQTAVLARRARRRAWRPLPAAVADEESRQLLLRRRDAREQADALRAERAVVPAGPRRRLAAALARRSVTAARWVDERVGEAWAEFDERFSGTALGASWRRTLDGLVDDLELGFGPLLDELAPDVVHAHDMHVLGVAVHAARRAAAAGRSLKVVYDAHEYVPGLAVAGAFTPRSIAAWADLEAEYVRHADRVVAVSAATAEAIQQRFGLDRRPDVVLNVPVADGAHDGPRLREVCGLADDVPLLVYAGVLRDVRGVDTSIAALHELPGVHLAVVCVPDSRTRPALRLAERARQEGLGERVHLVDPVQPGQVVGYLASADVGLVPMLGGWLNHELTLPNKLFEYVAARLPVVASDLRSLGSVVREHRLGETFAPGDAADLARAVRAVLDDLDRYRASVADPQVQRRFSWQAQEEVLHRVYSEVLGVPVGPRVGDPPVRSLQERPVRRPAPAPGEPRRVLLGPLNTAGQASALAGAAGRHLRDVTAESLMLGRRRGDPVVDLAVTRDAYRRDLLWQTGALRHLLQEVTDVVVEDGLPLAGTVHGEDGVEQALILADAGVRPAFWLVAPTGSPEFDAALERLQRWREYLEPELLVTDPAAVPLVDDARWLPLVLDAPAAAGGSAVWPGRAVPVVSAVRPAPEVRDVLAGLAASGRVTYRPDEPGAADVVVVAGTAGGSLAAVRALARGAVVLAAADGLAPVVDVADGGVRTALERVLADPATALAVAGGGPGYVRDVHDGRRSAQVLGAVLGLGTSSEPRPAPTLDWAAASSGRPPGAPDGGDQ